MGDVTIPIPRGNLRGCLVLPPGPGPWPGVIVIHDAVGMTPDLRAQADWLAGAGYLALAPDLFSWGRSKARCFVATMRDIAAARGPAFGNVDATREWLVCQDGCTGHVGIIGFCLGGGFAMLLAAGHGFEAASINFGGAPRNAEALMKACPMVGSYGGRDRSQRGAAAKLKAILDAPPPSTTTSRSIPELGIHSSTTTPPRLRCFAARRGGRRLCPGSLPCSASLRAR